MENALYKRSLADLQKHQLRCESCKQTGSFCYRPTSHNNFDIIRSFFCCHSYFCESCARKKKSKLHKKIKNIKPGFKLRMLTLTLSTEQYTPEEALENISSFFNLFVKYMRYRGFKFQYFKIIELTENHQAHIHALVNCYMDNHIVSYCWQEITGSWHTNMTVVNNKRHAVNYILKYISKAVNPASNYLFYMMKKRRYSFSQNFFLPNEKEPPWIQSKVYFWNDFDLLSVVNHYFSLKFSNYNLIRFNLLN